MSPSPKPPAIEVTCFRCGLPGDVVWRRNDYQMMRCPQCEQQFVSPRSVGFDSIYQAADYFDGMNQTNRVASMFRRVWFRSRHRAIRRWSNRGAKATLIEIGPSWGEFVQSSVDAGYHVAASEFSESAATVVEQRFGIPVQRGSFTAQFFLDAGFGNADVVCFWDVIEHVPDPSMFVAEVHRVCRPGSVVGFSCPDAGTPLARMMRSKWHTFKPDEHLWHFNQATIRRLFDEAGFDIRWLSSSPLRGANLLRFDCMTGVAVRR